MKTNELLRRYVDHRSEGAFTELVGQYIDLVYSSALRQVNGDVPAAQDVAQAVFTDLARKAPRLTRHPSLAGWLYTSTRFLAAKSRRAEQRRRSYEQEAYQMNQILQSPDSSAAWQELRPLLDDAMHDLSSTDREAVLMRYFERLPLTEIGARMGIKEKAAHMRIARAIDRLRGALAKRGVTSTAAALAAVLTENVVGAAPAGTVARVSRVACAGSAGTGAVTWGLLKFAGLAQTKSFVGVGAAILAAALIVLSFYLTRSRSTAASNGAQTASHESATIQTSTSASAPTGAGDSAPVNKPPADDEMALRVVADDTGQPVAGAIVIYRVDEKPGGRLPLLSTNITDKLGVCGIPVARRMTEVLLITTRIDGFVDTTVDWSTENGDRIPPRYTMRLVRSAQVGGKVVNEQGEPVSGAAVELKAVGNPLPLGRQASPRVYTLATETAVTDANGHWQINRFAKSSLSTITFRVSHPDYVSDSPSTQLDEAVPEKELLAGDFIYKLDHGVTVSGTVVDAQGEPVSGVKVELDAEGRMRRTTNRSDGTFVLAGCKVGNSEITAQAPGFALTMLNVEITNNQAPLRVELAPGNILRLRVVDTNGAPVPDATVRLVFTPPVAPGNAIFAQSDLFRRQTGSDGRVVWDGAPQRKFAVMVSALPGYQLAQNIPFVADSSEHQIVLHSARIISGTVRDATTGEPISAFRITAGYIGGPGPGHPTGGGTNVHWMLRATEFLNGTFRWADANTATGAKYKFEADGYVPFITRVVGQDEGSVAFDILLYPAVSKSVTVLTTDGKPATNASIGLVKPGAELDWIPGGFALKKRSHDVLVTDSAGKFDLPQDDTITQVVAASPEGCCESTPAALAAAPTMRLQPWGRIEGTFLSGGKSVSSRVVTIAREGADRLTVYRFDVETDTNGHFIFPKVPPGDFRLCQQDTTSQFRRFEILDMTPVTVHFGKTAEMPVNLTP